MSYSKGFLTLICFLLFSINSYSQYLSNLSLSPGVSIGYTLGEGINYGFELDLGLLKFNSYNTPHNLGLSFSKYWTHIRKKPHRHMSFNIMLESNIFDFKIGYGRARNNWGYGKRNRCRISGLNVDLGVTTKSIYTPWVGYKTFIYATPAWAWYHKSYESLYVKYKYDVVREAKNILTPRPE